MERKVLELLKEYTKIKDRIPSDMQPFEESLLIVEINSQAKVTQEISSLTRI